ncbi:MAG TPA: site-2 protease family protein [Piscinibacter sp.]|nr:site-2 protease family protein [Rubrivivax sp.]TXH57046.1 MAG: site-2 protease family protein [Burkholderiaceae bacterium]HNJ82277.1 site-2 protease family protein [Piscinibacter sp.]HNK19310.1 site-2 protease family protein [Piscinibacter sp.]
MKLLLALLAKGGFGKLLTTGGTMLVSMAVYAISFGWPYAVGFVLLILVHELGHYIAARQHGLNVGAPVFIPFVGAWISLKETRLEPEAEARIAMAGPMLGSIAALVCYLLALDGQGRLYMALAQAGFMLNLFNLLPLAPLDGGRVVGVISPRLWLLGVPLLVALFLWRPSPLLLLIAVVAAPSVWAALKGTTPEHARLARAADRFRYAAQYLLLAAALGVMGHEAHEWLLHGAR